MPLLGTQPHEDLAGHEVGDRPARGAEHRGHVVAGLHRGAGPGGQDQRGTPAAGPLDDRLEHVTARRPGVLEGQPRGLLPAEPEHVAAQHGQVAQELGDETGDGQVPPGHEQDAEPLRVGVEPVRDQAHAGRREEVRVIDDQQPRGSGRVAGGPREDVLDLGDRAGGRGGVPDRVGERGGRGEPPGDAQGLPRPGRRDQHGHGALGGGIEVGPQLVAGGVRSGQPGSAGDRRLPPGTSTGHEPPASGRSRCLRGAAVVWTTRAFGVATCSPSRRRARESVPSTPPRVDGHEPTSPQCRGLGPLVAPCCPR